MTARELRRKIFIGIVEDNQDPKRLGRCKCRVLNIFDDIPTSDLPWATPWKDLNGNQFILPDKGKVVSVVFDEGNIYKPEYIFAEHYNINLEKKLSELSESAYVSMRSLLFDHKTQIYSNDNDGLMIDYKFNNINITDSSINVNLKDNFGYVNIGTSTADQQAILGNNFLNWFDNFLKTVVLNGHLGNLAAPTVPTPAMLEVMAEYFSLRDPKFLSHHVNIVDNEYVSSQKRGGIFSELYSSGQLGDAWKSTVKTNDLASSQTVDYKPKEGLSTNTPTGELTVSSSTDGASNLATNPPLDPGPIDPTNNPDVIRILETLKAKKYTIFTKPYEMNIIGVRRQYEGMAYSNAFVDSIYLIFKTDNTDKWEVKKYPISTLPGYYPAVEVYVPPKPGKNGGVKLKPAPYTLKEGEYFTGNTKNGVGIDVKLTAVMQGRGGHGILKPAQYIDVYQMGTWIGYDAMLTRWSATDQTIGQQQAYRDNSAGKIIKYTSENKGSFGMYIHLGFYGGRVVSNWSEGCQVFSKPEDLNDFFKWCKLHKEKYGNVFSYTLIEERDIVPLPPQAPPVGPSASTTIPENTTPTGATPSVQVSQSTTSTGSQSTTTTGSQSTVTTTQSTP